jgi:hypothetical protein
MNIEAILHYPIGDFQRESNLLEQIKDLITDEADHLLCCESEDWAVLAVLMNSYRLLKEGVAHE